MSRTPQEQAVRQWVADALGIETIFASQAGPRPAKPYATVEVIGAKRQGAPDKRTTDEAVGDKYKRVLTSHRSGTVSVNVWGDGAGELFEDLELSLDDQDVIDANDARGVVVSHLVSGPRLSREQRDTAFEGRAQGDFVFRWIRTKETSVPVIDSATTALNLS